MPPSICSRSLLQQSLDGTLPTFVRQQVARPRTAWFSTTHCRMAKPAPFIPKKGSKSLVLRKKKNVGAAKETDWQSRTEEAKTARRRIILTNNNALQVTSLKDLDKTNIMSQENEGQVMGLPEEVVDALRAADAFKRTQGWSLFWRPAVLIRKESTKLAKIFEEVEESIGSGQGKKTIRRVISGERSSGKSALLLHGMTIAFLRGWFVVNLPEGFDITNATTEYAPLPQSEPMQYTQNTYTSKLLQRILESNRTLLQSTQIATTPDLPIPLNDEKTLEGLVKLGIENPDASWPVFSALWKEITQPERPPILFVIDGLSHVMRNSQYLSADMKPIHAHDFTLVRHFVDHLSGRVHLSNGGVVLAATSHTNAVASPAMNFSVEVAEARQEAQTDIPQWNPHKAVDQRAMEALKDLRSGDKDSDVFKVGRLSKEEARSIMEYYAESGMLRHQVNERFVAEKWSMAGMGNVGELERASVRTRI